VPARIPEETGVTVNPVHAPWQRCVTSTRTVLFLSAVVLAGCGNARVVLPVRIDPAAVVPAPSDARAFGTYDAAIQGIASILTQDLGLPVPRTFTVYVYANQLEFERGLVSDAHIGARRAAELAEFAIGVGKPRQLLLNDGAVEQHGREWVRLVAHEMAHLCQFELARGEGRGEQWLAEGMAEWTAFSVLERLGLDSMERRKTLALAGIRDHAALAAARLDLDVLGTPRGFTARHLREGSLSTYRLAFLMSDYLIAREGLPKVIDYFRSFATRSARLQNFERGFGQPLDDFEREVHEYLNRILH
jgi:hypothetical protein